jgi:hypothetical protein
MLVQNRLKNFWKRLATAPSATAGTRLAQAAEITGESNDSADLFAEQLGRLRASLQKANQPVMVDREMERYPGL